MFRLDEAVGQAVIDRSEDLQAVSGDSGLEFDEGLDATASGPRDPPVQRFGRFVGWQSEDGPKAFLEEVGPVEPWIGIRDPGQLGLLVFSEVFGVLPQRVPGVLQSSSMPGGDGDSAAG